MLLIMGVNLFTSRIILQALGIEDFGLYNIVGGVVVLFTFVNNAMVTSTQRFLNYELGRGNLIEVQKIFSASLSIHVVIAVIFLMIAETFGLYFLNTYIQIPIGRESAANWVYQFTIIASIINIMRTPYNASIIAYERMSFFASISIIEVVLKLLIVYLIYLFIDRLVSYSVLVTIVSLVICGCYYFYCRRNFLTCRYKFEYDKRRFFSIASFSGWSLFGSAANIGAQQGINILQNIFFGVTVNAAIGVANQVNNAIYNLVSNFQMAFNPQIIKSYASGRSDDFFHLIYRTSRYSFFLIFILALPVIIYCPELLSFWLTDVPEYSIVFCRIMIINSLFDALSGPLWMSVYASGKIKKYQLTISSLLFSTLILAYIVAYLGYNPYFVLAVKPLIGGIIYVYRLQYCSKVLYLNLYLYMKSVVFRCFIVSVLSCTLSLMIYFLLNKGLLILLIKFILSLLVTVLCVWLLGLTSSEKKYIYYQINKVRKNDL